MSLRNLLSPMLALAVVPVGLVLPVVSVPTASPQPVAPQVRQAVVRGVDPGAVTQAPPPRTEGGRDTRRAVLTPPTRAGSFSTIGVTWQAGSAPEGTSVQIRVRSGGRWGAWSQLEVDPSPAGAPAGSRVPRDGTQPSYVGASDGYQVQVGSPSGAAPVDVQVVAVDPGASPADAVAGTSRGTPLATAAAEASRPSILGRSAWGADESLRNCGPEYMSTVKAIAVHHTDSINGYSSAQVPSLIRGIYAFHTQGRGWCDIAYNVVVDRFGRLWEGRAGGLDRPVMSAATGGFNTDTSAISAIGNFDTAPVPSGMVDAIARFSAWKLGLHRVNPAGWTRLVSSGGGSTWYSAGTAVTRPTIFAHRDTGNTVCPGKYLYGQLSAIRAKAYAYAGPSLFSPGLNYFRVDTKDFPSFVVNAGTNGQQDWRLAVYRSGSSTAIWSGTGSGAGNRLSAIWPRVDTSGRPVGAGTYRLILTSSGARTWSGEVTITGDAVIPPGDPAALATVYTTPGATVSAGREWRTSCGAYSSTSRRCFTSIYASWIQRTSSGYRTVTGWKQNNLAYMDRGYAAWAGNPLAAPGDWTSGGRRWRTTCSPSSATGARQCRTYIWASLLKYSGGRVVQYQDWVINSVTWLGDGR